MKNPLEGIARLFGRKETTGSVATGYPYPTAEPYAGLRNTALTVPPPPGMNTGEVWGLVTDIGMSPRAVITLIAFADGSVSLYFSSGGGMLGMGGSEGPARAARELLAAAPSFAALATDPDPGSPLPPPGSARFHFRMGDGSTTAAEATQAELTSDAHPLSPLFRRVDALLTEIRKWDEERQRANPPR